MTVAAYTDLFNTALDNLADTLSDVTGIVCVTDPRNIAPPCVFIDAPSFTAFNYNIVTMTFPIRILSLGPSNLDAQRSLLNLASLVLGSNVAVTDGRPTIAIIGGSELPAYDLTVNIQSQTS
jgi:hypothetical protein